MATISIYYEIRNGKKYWRGEIVLGYDDKGKPIRKTASSYQKSTVIAKLKKYEKDYEGLDLSMDFQGTVQDLFKTWIFVFKKPTIQDLSFSKYEEAYRLRIKDTNLGLSDIKDVNKVIAQAYINDLRLTHSEELTQRTLMYLKVFFSYLVSEGALVRNPFETVKVKKDIKADIKYKVYSKDDQQKIIEALDLLDPVEMMIYMAFATGLRLAELTALTWNDVKNGVVDVNKQYNRTAIKNPDGTVERGCGLRGLKTQASYRQVPIPKKAQKELHSYRLNQLKLRMLNLPDYEANNLVFPNEKGRYQNLNRPTRRIESICKKVGVDYISFHATRHSYITRLFENGVDIKTIQKLAGHEKIETTLDIYTHTNKERKEEAVDLLSDVL